MVQDPEKRRGISEEEMRTKYPKTYLYLKRFEKILRQRQAFKRYFTKKVNNKDIEIAPFYSMFDVGDYTFAPYKVVWPNIASEINAAVISLYQGNIITLVGSGTLLEAHYICALINSGIVNLALKAYSMKGGKSFGDPHVLRNICIPKFNPKNKLHVKLANLSQQAHKLAQKNDIQKLKEVEEKIDNIAAKIWKLTKEELKEIKLSLQQLM